VDFFFLMMGLLALGVWTNGAAAQIDRAALIGRIVEKPSGARYAPLDDAIKSFERGDMTAVRQRLSALLKQAPELPPADTTMAQMHFGAGQIEEGEAAIERAIAAAPSDPEAYLLAGELALARRQLPGASALLLQAAELATRYRNNRLRLRVLQENIEAGLAAVAAMRNNWAEASRRAEAALKHNPQSSRALTTLGRAQFKLGDARAAYASFKKAGKTDATVQPEISMALLYEELVAAGDATKRKLAQQAIELAIKNDPQTLSTQLIAARWALNACQFELAATSAAAAVKLAPASPDAQLLAGLVALAKQDYTAAVRGLEATHLQAPLNADAATHLAIALSYSRQPVELNRALQFAQLATRLEEDRSQPAGREAAVTLAWALHRNGRGQQAATVVQQALSAGDVDGDHAYRAAVVLIKAGDTKTAYRLLQAATSASGCFSHRNDAQSLLKTRNAAD